MSYEYKVIPAPTRGLKAKGVKTAEDRFAHALQTEINTLAADGWEYVRADTLPCEQREGLMSKTTVFQNMLVFRRTKSAPAAVTPAPTPSVAAPPPPVTEKKPLVAKASEAKTADDTPAADKKSDTELAAE